MIAELLQEIGTSFRVIKSHEVIKMIGEIVRYLLTLIVHENLKDEHRLLYTIIDSSSQIYFQKPTRRKLYLYQLVQEHGIWSDIKYWKLLLEFSLHLKLYDADRRKRLRDSSQNFSLQKITDFSERTLKNLMSSEEEKFNCLLAEHQNLVFNELSKFVSFFVNLQMPYEQSHKMLLDACALYLVSKEKQALLVTELR